MEREEVVNKAKNYSNDIGDQMSYVAGFQEACNIIREKINTCNNEDFCDAMEDLSLVSYMDIEIDWNGKYL